MPVYDTNGVTMKPKRRNLVKLCPAAEKIINEIPIFIGLTGDALRLVVEQCVAAQRRADARKAKS